MTNYILQPNETILYQGNVFLENKTATVELVLTNINLVFIITTRKLLSKKQIDVEIHPIEDIKIYNNTPQIKQKHTRVEVYLTHFEIAILFPSIFESSKFVNAALHLLTGTTVAERSASKLKDVVGLMDDALGINTVGTAKNVLENGVTSTLLGGFGKKNSTATKISTTREVVGIAKELLTPPAQQQLSTPTEPFSLTNEQLDTLKKLKELVDMGILTQEEFDTKKKQLLGL